MTKKRNKTWRTKSPPFNSNYQPSKRDMERVVDMPGADMKTLSRAFFRPHKDQR